MTPLQAGTHLRILRHLDGPDALGLALACLALAMVVDGVVW